MSYPANRWYVAAHAGEVGNGTLLARTLLGQRIVMFRDAAGQVAALEDRCAHRALPLSMGCLEEGRLRCGYHGLLFDASGRCVEVPGQQHVPEKARVASHVVREQDGFIWWWHARESGGQPQEAPPRYAPAADPRYEHRMGYVHYDAPWQLVHDNLLDLTHVGYVHSRTIGGIPRAHSEAPTQVTEEGDRVRVRRELLNTPPPATFRAAWPFRGNVDRWQEITFHLSHVTIFACAVDAGTDEVWSPDPRGLQIPSFHGVTPESGHSSHYFWRVGINQAPGQPGVIEEVARQFEATFHEDYEVINAQFRNQRAFGDPEQVLVHFDVAPSRARRIIARLAA